MQEERRRYVELWQPPAAQTSPSPHHPNAALAATIRGRAGGISLTADVGLWREGVGRNGNAATNQCWAFHATSPYLELGSTGLRSSLPTMLINWLYCQSKHSFTASELCCRSADFCLPGAASGVRDMLGPRALRGVRHLPHSLSSSAQAGPGTGAGGWGTPGKNGRKNAPPPPPPPPNGNFGTFSAYLASIPMCKSRNVSCHFFIFFCNRNWLDSCLPLSFLLKLIFLKC